MKKLIEFQASTNGALATRSKSSVYEDLVFTDAYRKYRHQFGPGKTKIRLLPATAVDSKWLLEIPTLQDANGRHTHPRVLNTLKIAARSAQSVYDLAYVWMKKKYPDRLFGRSNKTGFRLLSMPIAICWAVVEDTNGIKLRLLHNSFYDGKFGGATGLGRKLYDQALRDGPDCRQPGHPLNHRDGTSLLVERIAGSDTKFASYRVSHSEDRSPLQPLLDQVTDVEYNMLRPLEETIQIVEPEEEWQLLRKVVGDDLLSEIRSAKENPKIVEGQEQRQSIEESIRSDESSVGEPSPADEAAYHPEDYKDFPAKWNI